LSFIGKRYSGDYIKIALERVSVLKAVSEEVLSVELLGMVRKHLDDGSLNSAQSLCNRVMIFANKIDARFHQFIPPVHELINKRGFSETVCVQTNELYRERENREASGVTVSAEELWTKIQENGIYGLNVPLFFTYIELPLVLGDELAQHVNREEFFSNRQDLAGKNAEIKQVFDQAKEVAHLEVIIPSGPRDIWNRILVHGIQVTLKRLEMATRFSQLDDEVKTVKVRWAFRELLHKEDLSDAEYCLANVGLAENRFLLPLYEYFPAQRVWSAFRTAAPSNVPFAKTRIKEFLALDSQWQDPKVFDLYFRHIFNYYAGKSHTNPIQFLQDWKNYIHLDAYLRSHLSFEDFIKRYVSTANPNSNLEILRFREGLRIPISLTLKQFASRLAKLHGQDAIDTGMSSLSKSKYRIHPDYLSEADLTRLWNTDDALDAKGVFTELYGKQRTGNIYWAVTLGILSLVVLVSVVIALVGFGLNPFVANALAMNFVANSTFISAGAAEFLATHAGSLLTVVGFGAISGFAYKYLPIGLKPEPLPPKVDLLMDLPEGMSQLGYRLSSGDTYHVLEGNVQHVEDNHYGFHYEIVPPTP